METINTYYEDYPGLVNFVKNNHGLLLDSSNRSVLVQVFSGICDRYYLSNISKQIIELIPHAQVIGTTTSGEIMNGLVSGLKTVLSFSVFHHSNIKVVFAEKKDDNDYELGKSIANNLNSDSAKVLILFSTGLCVNASQLLKGIQSVNPGLPVAGGNAGDNRSNKQRFVSCNENATDCGIVGVVLEGEHLTVSCHSHLGWQPIGKEMTITRAEGSRVYTIDNTPAYQVYRQYLGLDTSSNIVNVVEFPLTICKHGFEIARSPYIRYDDDSLGFFGDIDAGEKVRFSFGHVEIILEKIDKLLQLVRQQPVESIFVYSCASRRGFLQEAAQIETLPLQNIAPTAGFFTSGEFFHANNSNQLLNATMTTLALSESKGIKEDFITEQEASAYNREANSQYTEIKDNVADRSIVILKSLTHLINIVTSELNEKTAELEAANRAISKDITNLKRAEIRLQEERNFNAALLDTAGDLIVVCDHEGRIVLFNQVCEQTTGFSFKEVKMKYLWDVVHSPDDVANTQALFDKQPTDWDIPGIMKKFENYWLTKNGRHRLISWTMTYLINDEGIWTHAIGTGIDITEQRIMEAEHKQAEEALRESERRFREMLENVKLIAGIMNTKGAITYCNDFSLQLLGYKQEDVIGHDWYETFVPLDIRERDRFIVNKSLEQRIAPPYGESEIITESGERRTILWSNTLLLNPDGSSAGFAGIGEDITERRIAEKRSQELMLELQSVNRELNDFAHIVSHDLKVPLRGIRSLADWLYNDYKDKFDADGKEQLDMLKNRVVRMNNLIEGILRYSRLTSKNEEKIIINFNKAVQEVIEMLERPENISIIIENELPSLTLERTRTQQLFTNLISNAIKYMDKPKGEIRISCQKQGEFWMFCVRDNGCGIEERNFDKIFTIFKTLKAPNDFESTGIGLTIVKKIVETYGGKVWVESKIGEGSAFYFTLPVRN